jgi:hypothetical protein
MTQVYDWNVEVINYDHVQIDNGLADNKIVCEIIVDEDTNSIRVYKGRIEDQVEHVEIFL